MPNIMDKVYYFNFPFKMHSNNGLLGRTAKLLLPSKGPYIISTAHNKLNFDDLLSHTKLKRLSKTGLDIYLFEVLSTYKLNKGRKECNRTFYAETLYNEQEHSKLYSHEFDVIQNLAEKLNIKINVYTCERNVRHFFEHKYQDLNLFCFDIFLQNDIKRPNKKNLSADIDISKKFWCANWRYTPARHSIMGYLAHRDGNYSWHFKAPKIDFVDVEEKYMEVLLKGNKILNKENFYLDVPVKSKINILNDHSVYYPKNELDNGGDNPVFYNSLLSCFVGIITETRFGQPQANFSEKTLHPIRCRRPFVLVAPPFTLQYMKELGFKTFDKWWSEDYDKETDHFKRLEKIYDIIDYIDTLSIEEMKGIHVEMANIFEHNLQTIDFYKKNHFPILN